MTTICGSSTSLDLFHNKLVVNLETIPFFKKMGLLCK